MCAHRRRLSVVLALLGVCAVLCLPSARDVHAAVPPVSTSQPPSSPPPTVPVPRSWLSVSGSGNGHGVGLSQWGAFGWASRRGWSASQILSFYYGPKVEFSQLSAAELSQPFSVRLGAFDDVSRLVFVAGDPAVPLKSTAVAGSFQTLVFERVAGSMPPRWAVSMSAERACDPLDLTPLVASVGPSEVFVAGSSSVAFPLASLPLVCSADGSLAGYRGRLAVRHGTVGELRLVNVVPLELYLRSVVPAEVPASWAVSAPAAVEAQVVAARSYAMAEGAGRSFSYPVLWPTFYVKDARFSYAKTCDSQACQVYAPAVRRSGVSSPVRLFEFPAVSRLVVASSSRVLRSAATVSGSGSVVSAMFSSSNGGQSRALGVFPSVVDAEDPLSPNPWRAWSRSFDAASLDVLFPTVGRFQSAQVMATDVDGRVLSVRLSGSAGEQLVSGEVFRQRLGLPSSRFSLATATP